MVAYLLGLSGFQADIAVRPDIRSRILRQRLRNHGSYALGRIFDTYVLVKYGSYIHITPDRLARVHSWFERRGRWTLLVGYFVPGVRHLTGYIAGASELSFSNFALFAYTGAFCWAAVFITLGYFLGEEWNRVVESLDKAKFLIIGLAAVAGIAWFAYLRRRSVRP